MLKSILYCKWYWANLCGFRLVSTCQSIITLWTHPRLRRLWSQLHSYLHAWRMLNRLCEMRKALSCVDIEETMRAQIKPCCLCLWSLKYLFLVFRFTLLSSFCYNHLEHLLISLSSNNNWTKCKALRHLIFPWQETWSNRFVPTHWLFDYCCSCM